MGLASRVACQDWQLRGHYDPRVLHPNVLGKEKQQQQQQQPQQQNMVGRNTNGAMYTRSRKIKSRKSWTQSSQGWAMFLANILLGKDGGMMGLQARLRWYLLRSIMLYATSTPQLLNMVMSWSAGFQHTMTQARLI